MLLIVMILIAVLLDMLLGEPRRYHPLAGFGRLACWLESKLYGGDALTAPQRKLRGIFAWLMLVMPLFAASILLSSLTIWGVLLQVACLYIALGTTSLFQHGRAVERALRHADLPGARQQVAMMVSRDSNNMDEHAVSRATIESILENGNDAIFGTLFWFVILGGPGAVLYRLANTLDAMWGYRNHRYIDYGWMAARMDDLLNWLPARLTAISYALLGNTSQALYCWFTQAKQWSGRNAGTVMATGAAALNLQLGGAAVYQQQLVHRPLLGAGQPPQIEDIDRSLRLVQKTQIAWLILLFIGGLAVA